MRASIWLKEIVSKGWGENRLKLRLAVTICRKNLGVASVTRYVNSGISSVSPVAMSRTIAVSVP